MRIYNRLFEWLQQIKKPPEGGSQIALVGLFD
jgi:hypothetical protein